MKKWGIIVLFSLLFPLDFASGEHCPNCIVNWCRTAYPTGGDYDGDGMTDNYEIQLARRFKPTLYYDDANSEITYCVPSHYNEPPYSHESGPNHGLPADIIMDGTVYVHVRPYDIVEPGVAFYIEIAYWFYYTYNQAECQNGYLAEHGHDWEHIALCLSVPPDEDSLQVASIFFAQHEGWEFRGPDEVQWTGTPGLSSVKVFIVNGSHASYPNPGERCALWTGECVCYENANGGYMVAIDDSKIVNLYELGDYRAPNWLDYTARWPGDVGEFGKLPYGPAQGNEPPNDGHARWWNEGHFTSPPACVETWREDVPEPQYFQVSNFRDGQELTNALYLTWEDPEGGPRDGFALQRCLLPNFNDENCQCIAQLGPDVHSYFDSCLDGGMWFHYFLKTYRYHEDPAYRGCSWPAYGDGIPYGGPCTYDQSPAAPVVRNCDSCILRWEDCSWNEDGFIIGWRGEICDTVDRNIEEYHVSNCCTGKYGYGVCAFNEYGENCSNPALPCNAPNCLPRDGCDGTPSQVPSFNQWGNIFLIGLMIGTTVFIMNRENRTDS